MNRPLKVIVVGSGVAGMAFAHRLSSLMGADEVDIRLLSKAAPESSNSHAAQGGVAVVVHPSDSWEGHRDDTLEVGGGRCLPEVVERVVQEGPGCIQELLLKGARFDTNDEGGLATAREGGHSAARVVHRGDRTGAELVRVLRAQVRCDPKISVTETLMALDLLVSDTSEGRRCRGVRTMDILTGVIMEQYADVTVLATGGAGQVYRHTTNPVGATGSGVAMAIRGNVPLRDMAFVQFHPTALFAPEQEGTFLISEAVRGAGAMLLRPDRSRLMEGLHPMADLAPRNVVARAIHAVMREESAAHVLLDATQIGEARFAREFPMILNHCWSIGIDPVRQPIPVMPAAHYLCGGIRTDAQGRTELDGLYALGECASSGLHGADRLASNSLLEALVIPRHAAASVLISEWQQPIQKDLGKGQYSFTAPSPLTLSSLADLRELMMRDVGIVRGDEGLRSARKGLLEFKERAEVAWSGGERSQELFELRDLALVAIAICEQAIAEPGNAGTHWNQDAPPRSVMETALA
ncbi:MAG: L-aspartate oxidase [Flavobacteriales bacterium]